MAYSRIASKVGFCVDCADNIPKQIVAGRCRAYHYTKHMREKSKLNTKKSLNHQILQNRKNSNENLENWFKFHMEHSDKKCEGCGKSLANLKDREWKGSHHHILPKSLFGSVSGELINHAVLGYYCCHPQIHTSYENAQKMPIWNTLKERVQPILHLVKEKNKILEFFK